MSEVFGSELIFFTDALLLFWSEIVIHLKELSDFLDTLALNERCDLCGAQLQQRLDVQVVGGEDDIEEQSLVYVLCDVLGISRVDMLGQIVRGERLLDFRLGSDLDL